MERMRGSSGKIVRFATFTLDLESGELWNGSERLLLSDQAFKVLVSLVCHPGTLVTRDALRRELWADDTFVDFEHGLNAVIKRLRHVLGDSASTPRFIETLPRRGYRFIAAVEPDTSHSHDVSAAVMSDVETPSAPPGRYDRYARRWRIAGSLIAGLLLAILAVSWWVVSTRTSTDRVVDTQLVRMTSTAGVNVDPALSPDGSLLAYASDRAGEANFDIWVQPVAGGTPVQVTSDVADEIEPSFSADGARIVFSRREKGGIYVVSALGGVPRALVRGARMHDPKFSPDDRWVAYWTGLPVSITTAAGAAGSLWIVPSAGGSPRPLLPAFASARHPVWSADGRRLLFLGARNAEEPGLDWYTTDLNGDNPTATGAFDVLRAAGAASPTERPIPTAWTSNGIVLAASTARESANVWQLAVSAATSRVIGAPQRLTVGTALERTPSMDASGRVAFASVQENVDIWRVPLDERTGLARGPIERVTDNPAVDMVMNLSDGGRTMAFISSRTSKTEVWLREMATGRENQLTYSGATEARLSPDGSKALVWSADGEASQVDLLDVASGAKSRVCVACERAFSWSGDGALAIFAKAAPSRLFVHEFASDTAREVARHRSWHLRQARFSPDGRWISFYAAKTPDTRHIYVIANSESSHTPDNWIPVVADVGSQQSWAEDGSAIYYVSERDGLLCAWVQPLDAVTKQASGPPWAVQHLHEPRLRAGTRAIATTDVRGGYLYLTLTFTTGNIWMLERRHD